MLNRISTIMLCSGLFCCLALLWCPPAAARPGDDAPSRQGSVASPPLVVFVIESDAARGAAADLESSWRIHGMQLAAQLLPAGARPDTVQCLLLNTDAFNAYFARRLPDWGVGVAMPGGRLVALDYQRIPAVGRGLQEVFLHEMVHALLFQGAGNNWLPTWLHEGAAMYYSGEWRFTDTVSLVLAGRVPDLNRLQGRFPAPAVMADRAYRTSLLAVDRLRRQHGEMVIRDLVARTAATGDFTLAFVDVTGQSLEDYTRGFDAAMRLRFGWVAMLTSWPGLFVVLTVVFTIGVVRKQIRQRRMLARMEADEAERYPQDTL